MPHPVTEAIREARKAQGRTLADVGAAAGVTRGYVSTLELGKDNPIPKGVQGVLDTLNLRLVVLPVGTQPVAVDSMFLPMPPRSAVKEAGRAKLTVTPTDARPAALAGYRAARTSSRDLVITPHAEGGIVSGTLLTYPQHHFPAALDALDQHFDLARANSALSRVQIVAIVTRPDGTQTLVPAWTWVHLGRRGLLSLKPGEEGEALP